MEYKDGSKPALLPATISGKACTHCSTIQLLILYMYWALLTPWFSFRVMWGPLTSFSVFGVQCAGYACCSKAYKVQKVLCSLLLSVLEGTPWVCVQYSSNILQSRDGQSGPSKNPNYTAVQRRKILACQSLKKTSYERQKKSSKTR